MLYVVVCCKYSLIVCIRFRFRQHTHTHINRHEHVKTKNQQKRKTMFNNGPETQTFWFSMQSNDDVFAFYQKPNSNNIEAGSDSPFSLFLRSVVGEEQKYFPIIGPLCVIILHGILYKFILSHSQPYFSTRTRSKICGYHDDNTQIQQQNDVLGVTKNIHLWRDVRHTHTRRFHKESCSLRKGRARGVGVPCKKNQYYVYKAFNYVVHTLYIIAKTKRSALHCYRCLLCRCCRWRFG